MSPMLPTRLRTAANGMKGVHADIAREAADEIERLRTVARAALDEMCRTVSPRDSFTDVVDRLDNILNHGN